MDHRLYFIFGDLVSNSVAGILSALCAALLVGPGWNMFVAMLVMMALAMALCFVLSLALGILFGAMEIMVPVMLSGMFSGMFAGMWLAMATVPLLQLIWLGLVTGLVTTVIIWLVNARLRGIDPAEAG